MSEYVMKSLGDVGVMPDGSPYDLPPNGFDDAMNARFANGVIQKIGGNTQLHYEDGDDEVSFLSLVYQPFDYYSALGDQPQLMIGGTGIETQLNAGSPVQTQDSKLYRIDTNNGMIDISQQVTAQDGTVSQMSYNASESSPWYNCMVSNCIVMSNENDIPQVKQYYTLGDNDLPAGTSTNYFIDLPGWGQQTDTTDASTGDPQTNTRAWTCGRVRSFNNRLFAMDMWEAGQSGEKIHYPLRLRWSNFSTENQAPTLWDDLVANRLPEDYAAAVENGYAGWSDLADSKGTIQDILPLNNYLFIYTENEVYQAYPTNRSDSPFQFKKLYNDMGALCPNCVVEVDGKHFVVTQHDVVLHNGVSRKSIAVNRVKQKLIDEVCSVNPLATKCYLYNDRKEVWVAYVRPGSPSGTWACNKAAVWNWEFDTWYFMDLPGTYDFCLTDQPVKRRSRVWTDFSTTPWNSSDVANEPWRYDITNYRQQITVAGSAGKGIYQLDNGKSMHKWVTKGFDENRNRKWFWKVEPVRMTIKRQCIDFDNQTDEWRQKHVTAFYPQCSGTGSFYLTTGGAQLTTGKADKHSTYEFTIGTSRKGNVRLSHRYLSFEIDDIDIQSTATYNDMVIVYSVGGIR